MNHLDKNALLSVATGDFSIGIHNVIPNQENRVTGRLNVAKEICSSGLLVNSREGGTPATVRLFGSLSDVNVDDLERYFYGFTYSFDLLERWLEEGNDENIGVVVLIPSNITDRGGDTYFVGDYPDFYGMGISSAEQKNQHGFQFPMEQYIKALGYIPKEFILGYMHSVKSNMEFCPNDSFIGLQDEQKQDEFYSNLIDDMTLKGINLDKNFSKESLDFIRSVVGYPRRK